MIRQLLIACLLLLALPTAAGAHSLVRGEGSVVSYLSVDATSLNDLTVRVAGDRLEFRDTSVDGGIDPGTCAPGALDASFYVIQVFCPLERLQRVRIDLGDREDRIAVDLPTPVSILGGTGSDVLEARGAGHELDGGSGNDTLTSGDGNDVLAGGVGEDVIRAGAGDDRIAARDGVADVVDCGPGNDSADVDAVDVVDPSCEGVASAATPPPPAGSADVPGSPKVAVGAAVLQRAASGARVRVYATASEPSTLGASGFLDAAGLELPIERLATREVAVGGGGVVLDYRLAGRAWRQARKALAAKRRVRVRLVVVATDPGGVSGVAAAPPVRLLPGRDRALRAVAHHPEPNDVDGDEIRNEADNCPNDKNGSQTDTDRDGLGDACDADDDADGVADATDNCRVVANADQVDADGDGYGDPCPPIDTDADGVLDIDDNCDTTVNPEQRDLDGDDKGDACDRDRDGDRFDDQYDNCPDVYNIEPNDVNGNGQIDDQLDADRDGIGTACDPDEAQVVAPPAQAPPPPPSADAPAPALTATASTAGRQRVRVMGRGPIVAAACNQACTVRTRLTVPAATARRQGLPRELARGTAALAGAGRTYAFTRLTTRAARRLRTAKRPVRVTVTTDLISPSGTRVTRVSTVAIRP